MVFNVLKVMKFLKNQHKKSICLQPSANKENNSCLQETTNPSMCAPLDPHQPQLDPSGNLKKSCQTLVRPRQTPIGPLFNPYQRPIRTPLDPGLTTIKAPSDPPVRSCQTTFKRQLKPNQTTARTQLNTPQTPRGPLLYPVIPLLDPHPRLAITPICPCYSPNMPLLDPS